MRKLRVLVLLLSLVFVVLLFSFSSVNLQFSPDGGGVPSLGIVSFLVNLMEHFRGDPGDGGKTPVLNPSEAINSCEEGSPCNIFVTKKFKIAKPLDKDALWWLKFSNSEEFKEEFARINKEAQEWADKTSCPGDCGKRGYYPLDARLFMEPVRTNPGTCENKGRKETKFIEVEEYSLLCAKALSDAFDSFRREVQKFFDETCGEYCGYSVVMGSPVKEVFEENPGCTALLSSEVEVECTDRVWLTEYWIWIEIDSCLDCVSRDSQTGSILPDIKTRG